MNKKTMDELYEIICNPEKHTADIVAAAVREWEIRKE